MSISIWYERAEDQITRDYNEGLIDHDEYRAQINDLQREAREAAQDAAQQAYDNAMGGW